MNDNDIANQLRLVYRFMRFQRNNKWWWALFLCVYEVSMVKSYVCYKRYCELKGVMVSWNHHNWNEEIGYAHLDPDEDWPRKKSPPETPNRWADKEFNPTTDVKGRKKNTKPAGAWTNVMRCTVWDVNLWRILIWSPLVPSSPQCPPRN